MTRLEKMRMKNAQPTPAQTLPAVIAQPITYVEPDLEILPSQTINVTCIKYVVRKFALALALVAIVHLPIVAGVIYLAR
jgi:hypothetical protein